MGGIALNKVMRIYPAMVFKADRQPHKNFLRLYCDQIVTIQSLC